MDSQQRRTCSVLSGHSSSTGRAASCCHVAGSQLVGNRGLCYHKYDIWSRTRVLIIGSVVNLHGLARTTISSHQPAPISAMVQLGRRLPHHVSETHTLHRVYQDSQQNINHFVRLFTLNRPHSHIHCCGNQINVICINQSSHHTASDDAVRNGSTAI